MSDKRTTDRLEKLERESAALYIEMARVPIREGKVRTIRGNLIRATVNAPGGTSASVVNFDNAIAYVGTAPADGTGTFNNIHGETFADNAIVWLAERQDDGDWEPDRAGGSSGSSVQYFELTQDKNYADVAKLAKPVDETGTLDSGADAFHVVDDKNQFYGKAAAGGQTGYRGICLKFTDDYNSTGVPGWRIVTMEGPAYLMLVVLDEDYSMAGTAATPTNDEIWGRPSRDRRLPATGAITIHDDRDVASNAKAGDEWLVAWDEADEHYIFLTLTAAATPPRVGEQYGLLIADVPAATPTYDGTQSYIQHGYAADAVIPMAWAAEAGGDGGDQLQAELDGEGAQVVLPALNPVWTNIIKAGTTTNADKPVIVRGTQETRNVYTGAGVEELDVFVLTDLFYPLTVMKGQANGAVTGSAFNVDNLTLLWGRDPGVSSLSSVANPDSWDADDNAYCLVMQLTDGTWQAIDLACPA